MHSFYYSITQQKLLQISFPNIVIAGGLLILMLVLIFLIFVVIARQQQNKLYLNQKRMQEDFQQQLLQSQLETQEYSFNQISQELHDNIGQLLSSTKLLLGIASMDMETVPDTIKTAEQTVGKAIQDLRSLSKSLDKEWLHQFNFVENLEAEKDRINAARNIQVQLISQYEKLPLDPQAQVMLFRVVQEALQNSIKHAFPKHISIKINNTNHHFELLIEDDGRGFDIESAKKESLGLRNMEHRTQLLGGTIEWKPAETKGTVIKIMIPVKEE